MNYICFRLFDENYIDLDIIANASVSSENPSYLAENAYNFQRRSKVYRSQGYFKIDSTNKAMIFREGIGIELTANIVEAEYTSVSSFMTAVKTALDAAGVSTYTVTRENLRFKITSNGVGGDGRFELDLDNASFTSYDVLGFDNTSERTGALTYTADFIRNHTEEFFLWDMGQATNPDAFIAVGDRAKNIQISPTATILLQGNTTNNFDSPEYSAAIDYDDEILSTLTDDGIATDTYRYWKWKIVDRENPNGFVEIGAVFLGNYFNPQRGRPGFPYKAQRGDNTKTVFSESGQSFSDIKGTKFRTHNVDFHKLEKGDIEAFDRIWETFGIGKPFFVSLDTNAVFSSSNKRRIVFVKFDKKPTESLLSYNNFDMDMILREEL